MAASCLSSLTSLVLPDTGHECLLYRFHPRFLASASWHTRLYLNSSSTLLPIAGPERLSHSRYRKRAWGERGFWVVVAAVDNGEGPTSRKGQQLWRKELESSNELSEFDSLDDEIRRSSTIEKDIQRLTRKEEVEKLLSQPRESKTAVDERGDGIRDVADKMLVADFFFIIFSLAWLLAGLAEEAALQSSRLIDAWLPLWPSVFQPALGVFMAGAIVSALTKKK